MRHSILLLLALSLITFSTSNCSDGDSSQSQQQKGKPELNIDPVFPAPSSFQADLGDAVSAYYSVKDAFVETDPELVHEQLPAFRQALLDVSSDSLQGQAIQIWDKMQAYLVSQNEEIAAVSDINEQRKAFDLLSQGMEETINYFGVKGVEVYKQYCPMAFNDEGAFWFSSESKIMNPYFGDRMLHCGEVKQTIAAPKPL